MIEILLVAMALICTALAFVVLCLTAAGVDLEIVLPVIRLKVGKK